LALARMSAVRLSRIEGGCRIPVIDIRLFTTLAIPDWGTYTAGGVLRYPVASDLVLRHVQFSKAGRQGATFLPLRDYADFIGRVTSQ
jgi:hypothetical protein